MGLTPMWTGVLTKRGNLHLGRMLCKDGGRGRGEVSASQGVSTIPIKAAEARERQRRIPLRDSEGAWPRGHLDPRLLSSNTVR